MNVTDLTLRLLVLFFPGIICYYIVEALTVHRPRRSHEVFLFAFVYGMLSYAVYGLLHFIYAFFSGIARTPDGKEYRVPVPDGISFSKLLSDSNATVDFLEIFLVTVISVAVGLAISFAVQHKWLFAVAKAFRVTRKFGDPDVWSYAFNSNEVRWATVRDLERNLMFAGYVQAYSDVEESAELFLSDVIVYNEQTGAELYRVDRMYIAREKNNLTIELPNSPS